MISPLVIPLLFAFKTQLEFSYHPWALPKALLWNNFIDAWKAMRIDQGLVNTLIVALGRHRHDPPALGFLAGYIFARYKSKITEVAFYCILIGYFVPAQMVLIPLYKFEVATKLATPSMAFSWPWRPSASPSGP